MKNTLIVIVLVIGIAMFILGVVFMIMSEQVMKSIRLCWSPECSKEFIDALWRSFVYLFIGIVNMLVGALITIEAVAHSDDI